MAPPWCVARAWLSRAHHLHPVLVLGIIRVDCNLANNQPRSNFVSDRTTPSCRPDCNQRLSELYSPVSRSGGIGELKSNQYWPQFDRQSVENWLASDADPRDWRVKIWSILSEIQTESDQNPGLICPPSDYDRNLIRFRSLMPGWNSVVILSVLAS